MALKSVESQNVEFKSNLCRNKGAKDAEKNELFEGIDDN